MRIAILTTARSDFGPLKKVISHACLEFNVDLLVAGTHFLGAYGKTLDEIKIEFSKEKNLNIVFFDILDDLSPSLDQVNIIANTQLIASKWFANNDCDLLLFLGDRWELWGVTLPAFLHGIPMGHISGGEVTEGVIDDCIRHSHTKLAALHFAATKEYARNISLMGEEDWRISVVGECGLDLIHDSAIANFDELQEQFGINLHTPTLLVTFHPSTLDFKYSVVEQITSVLDGLENFKNFQIVFTGPGVEKGSDVVLDAIKDFVENNRNALLIEHLGSRNYLAVMKEAKVVIGNSSSGLVEASSFGVPAINIGQRQKNRLAADSVQHVDYDSVAIQNAITCALGDEYRDYAKKCLNPYDPFRDGNNSLRIIQVIKNALTSIPREMLCIKKFDNAVDATKWNILI